MPMSGKSREDARKERKTFLIFIHFLSPFLIFPFAFPLFSFHFILFGDALSLSKFCFTQCAILWASTEIIKKFFSFFRLYFFSLARSRIKNKENINCRLSFFRLLFPTSCLHINDCFLPLLRINENFYSLCVNEESFFLLYSLWLWFLYQFNTFF